MIIHDNWLLCVIKSQFDDKTKRQKENYNFSSSNAFADVKTVLSETRSHGKWGFGVFFKKAMHFAP